VISDNTSDNLRIRGSNATGNIVSGNYIGTNAAGTASLGGTGSGVVIIGSAHHNTVGGTTAGARNVIAGNGGLGVVLGAPNEGPANEFSDHNLVQGNYIGLNATGNAAVDNGLGGVGVAGAGATNNFIGGSVSGAGNVIVGTASKPAVLTNSGASSNTVQGNFLGTDATGSTALGGTAGVVVAGGASSNLIGGTTAAARNVISGNITGVSINNSAAGGATANLVQGNFIGTNAAGTGALPNNTGVSIVGVPGNLIGGTTAGAGNVISGNNGAGINIFGGANGNLVQGNLVGTDVSGTAVLGNAGNGVAISDSSGNTIGGATAAARNIISGNVSLPNGTGHGVVIGGSNATGNLVQGNYIGTDITGTLRLANGR